MSDELKRKAFSKWRKSWKHQPVPIHVDAARTKFNAGWDAAMNTRHTPEAVKGVVEALGEFIAPYHDRSEVQLRMGVFQTKDTGRKVLKARAALKAYKIHIGE